MKTPGFWAGRGLMTWLLWPLSFVTRYVTARRMRHTGQSVGIKVVCVGNASVGGAGKTQVALDILMRMQGQPFALTRGYGGALAGPVLVQRGAHTAIDVGDEALLLAEAAPTIKAHDRVAGARLALAEGATAIVMDDGLQNPYLHKDLSLLVIDGGYGFGNGLLLPAGPLREPVARAASRCRAAVLIGDDETDALQQLPPDMPVLRASLLPDCAVPLGRCPVIAFAGIGRPDKFFRSVLSLGAELVSRHAYPDHYVYEADDATELLSEAAHKGAKLVTTAKDFVKLPSNLKAACLVVRAHLIWENELELDMLLEE